MNVANIWAAAKQAAESLAAAGLGYGTISLGCFWEEREIAEFAALSGAAVTSTLYGGGLGRAPYVIFSIHPRVGPIEISAQGSRAAVVSDAAMGMHVSGPDRSLTPDEARAALESARA